MKIGLTGGIASGKSTVARTFASLGVTVIDSDQVARDVVEPGQPALAEIVAAFGADMVDPNGRLDRKSLRAKVFSDPSQRNRLESILHPRIGAELLARAQAAGGPYQVLEIPLLVETGLDRRVDRVLVVDCPEQIQISRLAERDGGSVRDARLVLNAQASRIQRLSAADDVIVNDGELEPLSRAVRALDRCYRKLAQDKTAAR